MSRWVFKKTDMVRSYIIKQSTRDYITAVQYYIKAVKRLKAVPKKIKADDGTEHSLTETIHIYLRSLNDDTVPVNVGPCSLLSRNS